MEKKDTLSSCSESEEQQMQLIQDKSKESGMVPIHGIMSIESIDERALIKESITVRVNERLMQTTMERKESQEQDTSSRSGNDAHVDDADIRPIYDEELKAEVNNDIDEIETIKIELEHSVAKLLAENELLHKEKEHLKQTYKDLFDSIKMTRFAKPSILGKPVLQPHRNQSVVRQPTAFKSERPKISKPRFASQVDVKNDLPKPVTTHLSTLREEELCHAKTSLHDYTIAHQNQSLVAEKTDISENRASRNFDLMINILTFEQRSSSLVLH
ncbi:hypothetical protein Tco_0743413 [Tanacetum coccineum]